MMTHAPIDYLLIGHITADLLPDGGRIAGGTVSYAARTAHAFGLRVGVLTSAASDEPLLTALSPYAEVISLPAETTTTYENIYTAAGRKQYVRGVAAPITVDDLPETWRNAPLVHFAPIAGEAQDATLLSVFPPSTTRLLTLQGWLRRWDTDGLVQFRPWFDAALLRLLDVVVFSEEDVTAAPDMIAQIAEIVPELFVTQAERGGLYYHVGAASRYSTPQVEVLEPTGAGDVFAAALLATYPRTRNWQDAAQIAAALAAVSVTRHGLEGAPTREEVLKLLPQ